MRIENPDRNKPTAERTFNRIDTEQFTTADSLDAIDANLAAARQRYAEICEAMDGLEAAGMWPSVPGVSWEARSGGPKRYMRLRWRGERPEGAAASTYIGADPGRQQWAKARIANRKRWQQLDEIRQRLHRWLHEQAINLRWKATVGASFSGHNLDLDAYTPADPGEWQEEE